jgi:predicted dehydrogenase
MFGDGLAFMNPQINIALLGCGAITELFYTPAILSIRDAERLCVSCLLDPEPTRLAALEAHFPNAIGVRHLQHIPFADIDLAVVASPQRFHSEQVITLLEAGVNVLCEKPLSSTLQEAKRMVASAESNQRILAVGLFRRFWPLTVFLQDLVCGMDLGRPLRFSWIEGGVFDWPAASPSFFQKESSSGGVFADLGAHVLDLLLHWFGPVASFEYRDDSMGGLENNAVISIRFDNGVSGLVRLSRDTPIPTAASIEFEHGTVSFEPGCVGELTLQLKHSKLATKALLKPALSYPQCFTAQIRNVCNAIRGNEPLLVPAREALPSMALISQCYASRGLLEQPWFSLEERNSAHSLAC